MSDQVVHRSAPPGESAQEISDLDRDPAIPFQAEPPPTTLFDLYEDVVKAHRGPRDAEIFEKIRQWIFSDFALAAHEFAGITKTELDAWQSRNQINLSAGHIRPDPIDLQRGYAWGHIRMTASANRLHSTHGPPSVEEIKLAWSKRH